jgi:hypothetical protein
VIQRMRDGTVVPSIFNVGGAPDADQYFNTNVTIKEGIVTGIIYPDDDASVSEKEIEYNVAVVDYDHQNNANLNIYRNCRLVNPFGTTNNRLTYTLQPSTQTPTQLTGDTNTGVFEDGARVLVVCVGGVSRATSCVILGGVQHRDQAKYSSDDGQFYDFTFNGINYNIDKDGQLTITFNSATDQDGKQANSAAAGTKIQIDKQGHFTVLDNKGQTIKVDRDAQQVSVSNGSESIVVDQGKKSVTITSGQDTAVNAGGKLSASSGSDMSLSSGGALSVKSSGATSVQSGGSMTTQANGQWQLKAQGNVQVTAGGNVQVMSSSGPVIQSQGPMTLVGLGSVPAAGVGISMCQGIGNLGLPVISTIITGSFTTFIGT